MPVHDDRRIAHGSRFTQPRHPGQPARRGPLPLGSAARPGSDDLAVGTSRAGAVDVALYTTASVDAVVSAHLEVDWEQLRAVEKGRRSPLAALAKQAALA
ncbi:hypothetical protein [Streptomyces pharetrae]|uniref:hypothetical protein n=1 Tax=Streptomyces pharetrae TaxID=291370 RepID=UPI00156D51E1